MLASANNCLEDFESTLTSYGHWREMDESNGNVYLVNFDKMCRLCLSQNIDILYIFTDEAVSNHYSLKHRIRDCVTLDVSQNDGLPQNICKACYHKINDWNDFKNFCIQSELKLRHHLLIPQRTGEGGKYTNTNSSGCDSFVKVEVNVNDNDALSDHVFVKSEDDASEGMFSDSDDTPLSKVKVEVNQKKKRKVLTNEKKYLMKKVKKEKSLKSSSRGRLPKAKPLCLLCNQKFSRFTELIEHQNEVHSVHFNMDFKNEKKVEEFGMNKASFAIYKCHVCKEEYPGREELRSHCKTQHNVKVIQPYPCSHCERQFPSWGLLVIHERKHTGVKPYSCDVCGKQNFISQTSLRRHKLMHLKVYSCTECGRDFNCDSALKAHIRCKHTNEKPYLCNICGRSFSLSAILMAHMTSHSSERKYVCDICGFASKTSGNHYRHKNTHKTGGVKSFHCETCGKSFDSKLKLSSHQIIHRPVRPHVCKVCSKAFLYNNKLERHILQVHARERPFPCSLCGKKLASKFGLGIHLKTHNRNENPKIEVMEAVPSMP